MKPRTVLLLLLSASPALCGQLCPGPCVCEWSPTGLSMDCSKKEAREPRLSLSMVPILVDDKNGSKTQSVEIAKFSNNNLTLDDQLGNYGYENVTELDFKSCNIQEILVHIFKGLGNLEKLDLGSNQIATISPGSFEDLANLKELDLSRNRLTTLSQEILIHLTNLVTLDLSNNKLQALKLPGLFKIDGQHETFKNLTSFSISSNPWRCNCELGPLHSDMKARALLTDDVKCSNVSGGGRWTDLSPDNFTCAPSLTLFTPLQTVTIGDNLTVQCKFEGNPMPEVFWRTEGGEVIEAAGNLKISSVVVSSGQYLGVMTTRLELSSVQAQDVGNMECCAVNTVGNATKVVRVVLSADSNLGLTVGLSISGGFAILMLLLGVLTYIFWKKNKKYQKESNTSSFELLNCSSSLPPMRRDLSDLSSINPVPKPPRTGQYGDSFSRMSVATAHGDDDDSKLRLTWQDELNCNYVSSPYMMFSQPVLSDSSRSFVSWLDNRPGSRASIVTMSTMISSPSDLPPSLQHSHSHPPRSQQKPGLARPGYVTLPRKVRPRAGLDCLGPRTSADGSSHTNINKITLHGVKFSQAQPASLEERANSVAVAADVEVRAESPLQQRSLLDPILEQELE